VSQTTNPVPSTSVPTPSTLGHVDARTTTLLPGTSWSLDCDCYSSAAAAVPTRPLTYRRARAGSQNSFASPPASASASASALATRRALGTARFRVVSWTARLAPPAQNKIGWTTLLGVSLCDRGGRADVKDASGVTTHRTSRAASHRPIGSTKHY
jgi:hypothetical protein